MGRRYTIAAASGGGRPEVLGNGFTNQRANHPLRGRALGRAQSPTTDLRDGWSCDVDSISYWPSIEVGISPQGTWRRRCGHGECAPSWLMAAEPALGDGR